MRRKVPLHQWDDVEKETVDRLPEAIDGTKVYVINGFTKGKDSVKLLKDGRRWKKNCPTKWQGHKRVRYADCKGSNICENEKCPYKLQYGIINRTQFEKKSRKDTTTVCKGCGNVPTFIRCPARRYMSYGNKSVTVYHCGEHSCPVVKNIEKNVERIKQLVEKNPNIKPSEIQSTFVLSAFRQQLDWSEVEKEVESTLDRNWISNIKKKAKREMQPVGHDFEALAVFKEYCDKKDVYYVYKINDRRGNPDKPSFVFKSSKKKAEIAINMDKDGNHFLNDEYCFFDGKHKRCKGFITLTASVYHPVLRRQIPLATMETESENTETITLFWTLFNEVLQKVSGDNLKKFNPIGWCTDMAGANMAGIINVYGDECKQRIKSCEFHFKDHRNKMSKKLDPESSETFKSICNSLLESATLSAYDDAKRKMDDFISKKEERQFLATWISWWNDRRGFIFRAFAPKAAPQMNQAEVIHAGWAHRDLPNLSLLDACQADVRDSVTLDVEFAAYERGAASGGTGPSHSQRQRKKHTEQINRAKKTGKEMFPESRVGDGLKIDPKSKHRPQKQKQKQNAENRTNPIAGKPTARAITLSCPPGLPCRPIQTQGQYNLTSSSSFCSSVAGLSTAPGIGTNNFSDTSMIPMNLSRPGTSPSSARNQIVIPNTNPRGQPCFAPSLVNVHGTSLSSTPNQTLMANADTTIQSLPWHSGMSPHPYELVPLPSRAQKCYGCGNAFSHEYRTPPNNLVVKHVDRRVIRRDDRTQQLVYGLDFCNTYYHPELTHIKRKNPLYSGIVHISSGLLQSLDDITRQMVSSYGLKITVTPSQ